MRFLLLLTEADHFDRWDAADEPSRQRSFDAYNAFGDAVRSRGTLVLGDALVRPADARTVTAGAPRRVTDGPYAETVEQLGGFYVIDVTNLDTALELAALLPDELTVEVRATLGVEV